MTHVASQSRANSLTPSAERMNTLSSSLRNEWITRQVTDVGVNDGKYYSVNFPLKAGIGDEEFLEIFKPVIEKIMQVFRPGAVVLQCGADSLTGDRLGVFNLTLKGHAECVR